MQLPVQAAPVRPDVSPYRPAAQSVQAPAPLKLYFPGLQMAAVVLVDPATQANPALQLPLQPAVGRPLVAPYVPAGHSVQDPAPAKLYRPELQIAAVALVDPATQA